MGHQANSSQKRIALIDGNNFYVSCERVMQPRLVGRPVIVLSNNDGCAISRSDEAKAMGIKMGAPLHEFRSLIRNGNLEALSANFALYGDLSERMMRVLGQFSPRQEIYSIDESFLDLTGIAGTGRQIGTDIRQRVARWTGIPTCVGIGPSKTLAKLANHLAKKVPRLQGVCDLTGLPQEKLLKILGHIPVDEVWGVGRRLAPRLAGLGISTAAHLASANPGWIRKCFSVTLANTVRELQGISCLDLQDIAEPRQQIIHSRSFGAAVRQFSDLAQAVSMFACQAAAKLRIQQSTAAAIQVSIFYRNNPWSITHQRHAILDLVPATDSTTILADTASKCLRSIFEPGYDYIKAGVRLLDICPKHPDCAQQLELDFDSAQTESAAQARLADTALMRTLDQINARFGDGTLMPASSSHRADAPWLMRQKSKSSNFTTNWKELALVHC